MYMYTLVMFIAYQRKNFFVRKSSPSHLLTLLDLVHTPRFLGLKHSSEFTYFFHTWVQSVTDSMPEQRQPSCVQVLASIPTYLSGKHVYL